MAPFLAASNILRPIDRKLLFVLKDVHPRRRESLAEYYVRNYSHLIPAGVSIIEFDENSGSRVLIASA
jgi:hypothetical protein